MADTPSLGINRGVVQLTVNNHIFDVELEITTANDQYLLKINGVVQVDTPRPIIQRIAVGKDKFSPTMAMLFGWGEAATPADNFQLVAPPPRTPEFAADLRRWAEAGGHDIPIPEMVWMRLAKTRETLSVLEIGPGLALLGADRSKKPGRRVVVTDSPPAVAYINPVEVHSSAWLPKYGELFNVIVVTGPVPAAWREALPKLLAPSGDFYFLPQPGHDGLLDTLAAAWGYIPYDSGTNSGDYRWQGLFVPPEPLGEGPGALMVDDLKNAGMATCQQCIDLARRINKWFSAGESLEDHMAEIVKDVLPRARLWWDEAGIRAKLQFLWHGNPKLVVAGAHKLIAGKGDLDYALSGSIRWFVRDCERRWVESHPAVEVQSKEVAS